MYVLLFACMANFYLAILSIMNVLPPLCSSGSTKVNLTLIFEPDAKVANRNPPAGVTLKPMEYTLQSIMEEAAETSIPNFVTGTVTIETKG